MKLALDAEVGTFAKDEPDWQKTDLYFRAKRRGDMTNLRNPKRFVHSFREALARDREFLSADVGLCSEPAYACLPMHQANKPIIGYFGVHIAFMLGSDEAQTAFYNDFRSMAQDPRHTFATVAPYLSLQAYMHGAGELPAVRPLSLHTQPAMYTATNAGQVLLNKRPFRFFDLQGVLNEGVRLGGGSTLEFVDKTGQGTLSFSDWASFRAGVYFPYDWLQTMTFYDWLAMGLPTFVPDSPMYTFAAGTNPRLRSEATFHSMLYSHHWGGSLLDELPEGVPHDYTEWHDLRGRVYWWQLTDFNVLPVGRFRSFAELLQLLESQESLWRMSAELRQDHLRRSVAAGRFWQDSLSRAMA